MKITINEDKLNNLIIKYLKTMFNVNDINWTYGTDDDGNEVGYTVLFYLGDFSDNEDLFKWYDKEYWNKDSIDYNPEMIEKWKSKSPILYFSNEKQKERLETLFGNKWQQPFKDWFEDNFKLPIKTIG